MDSWNYGNKDSWGYEDIKGYMAVLFFPVRTTMGE